MIAWTCGRVAVVGAALALTAPVLTKPAEASHGSRYASYVYSGHAAARVIWAGASHYSRYRTAYHGGYSGSLQCVPFARENTGIELVGNAATWWGNAAGVYERGARPEVGSVLNFRGTGRMRLGHVAVVSNVIDSRNVQIDHANWSGRGVVTRNVTVVDVSPANDWSAVRVALADGDFGSVYPTYGFIYDRPDRGTMVANSGVIHGNAPVAMASAAQVAAAFRGPLLNPAPLDLRPVEERTSILLAPTQAEEVAEAADDMAVGFRRHRRPSRTLQTARWQVARWDHYDTHMMRGQVLLFGRATASRGYAGRGWAGREWGGREMVAHETRRRGYADMVQLVGLRASRHNAAEPRMASAHAYRSSHHHGRHA